MDDDKADFPLLEKILPGGISFMSLSSLTLSSEITIPFLIDLPSLKVISLEMMAMVRLKNIIINSMINTWILNGKDVPFEDGEFRTGFGCMNGVKESTIICDDGMRNRCK